MCPGEGDSLRLPLGSGGERLATGWYTFGLDPNHTHQATSGLQRPACMSPAGRTPTAGRMVSGRGSFEGVRRSAHRIATFAVLVVSERRLTGGRVYDYVLSFIGPLV